VAGWVAYGDGRAQWSWIRLGGTKAALVTLGLSTTRKLDAKLVEPGQSKGLVICFRKKLGVTAVASGVE
jgi:hypothetical protein